MKADEELDKLGIYNCPECSCCTGEDWEYKDFSNRNIIVCPQCGNEIYLDDLYNEKIKLGVQEPPNDRRIFNKRQPDGSFKPIDEFFEPKNKKDK